MLNATPGRPLPQPSLASAGFWSSGRDDVLRIAHCHDCDRWFHPPSPMCPSCRSTGIALDPVCGRATVVAVSVNHQAWLPQFPSSYVVAIVALEEDDRARLTTNVVNCEAEDVRIGQRVRVIFEPHADANIWIPLFEPDPDAGDAMGDLPKRRDLTSALRPMVSSSKFEDKVIISGVGQSDVGRRLMVDPVALTVDAALKAVADAGLTLDDIDGLSTYPGPSMPGFSEGGVTPVEEALQLKPTWVNSVADTPGQNGSIVAAMLAVASGLCRHVLCFRTVWQASFAALQRGGQWEVAPQRAGGPIEEWRSPFGAMSAAHWIGLSASNYMHRYGATRELLGHIAVNNRTMATCNPEAIYRDPMTLDDYFNARIVTTPFGLYDCDVPCDGAVAVIVSAVETAADRPKPPVYVEAVGTQILERLSWDQDTLDWMPQAGGPAAHLWTRTSLRQGDVDIAQIYDGFTFNAVSWIEALGFCGPGEATAWINGGKTISLDGPLPLNTSGGQLSAGRLHGYGFMREAVLQLRGEATGRQVTDARVAVVAAGGGTPAGVLLLRRD